MSEFWGQLIGGSVASLLGALIGFSSAVSIQSKQRDEQLKDRKKEKLFETFARLHEIYIRLITKPIPEREISEVDFQRLDLSLTFLIVEYHELYEKYGNELNGFALSILHKRYYNQDMRDGLFLRLDAPLVGLLNEIQDMLVDMK